MLLGSAGTGRLVGTLSDREDGQRRMALVGFAVRRSHLARKTASPYPYCAFSRLRQLIEIRENPLK